MDTMYSHMDRVLPPVTSFVDAGQCLSYRGMLEAQMGAEVDEVEGRLRELKTRSQRPGYEGNRSYDWASNKDQRFQQQNHLPSSSPVNGQWPDVVPNEVQPSLQGHGVIASPGYPLTYGVKDSQWDYQRTTNNQLLLTNTGLNANMDEQPPSGLPHLPPAAVNAVPQRAVGGRAPTGRRSRGHRGGRQREKTPPFESDNERRQWEKERRKKDIHNKIEQRRRYNINDRIDDLGALLRKGGHETRHNKGAILRQTIVYIQYLSKCLSELAKMEEKAEELNRANETIRRTIQSMQNYLQTKDYAPSSVLSTGRSTTHPPLQDWTSAAQPPVYHNLRETLQRGDDHPAPYAEDPVVKQESSSGPLTPLYNQGGAAMAGDLGGADGLPSICENPPPGYYHMHGQYQY